MGVYKSLGRTPGVMRILVSQLTARLPIGMLSISVMLHIEKTFGDYTSAGLVLAFTSVGQGIAGPLSTRMMGYLGMRPVLAITGFISSLSLIGIALLPLPLTSMALLAMLMGLTTPPITASVRTIYPKLVPGRLVTALFSLDSALQEVIWIVGPVLAVFIAATVSTEAGLLVGAAFLIGGGAWFILSPEVGKVKIPRSRRRFGAVLTRPTVLISTLVGLAFVASFTAIEIAIVAIYGQGSLESGFVLAIFAFGSLVGGVTLGRREPGPWALTVRSAIVLVGVALTLVSTKMWWLSLMLFLGGVGTAPMFSALFTMVSATVKFSETAESYGWIQTGHLLGAAIGSAISGVAIDMAGPVGGIVVSTAFLVLTVAGSAATHFWVPDLRGRDASPIPDTEPVILPEDPLEP